MGLGGRKEGGKGKAALRPRARDLSLLSHFFFLLLLSYLYTLNFGIGGTQRESSPNCTKFNTAAEALALLTERRTPGRSLEERDEICA